MRVNVQLIDATTGNHLWADRFDKPIADLFDMQDEIVSHLANQLRPELLAAEAQRAEREPNPDSDGPLFPGRRVVQQGRNDNIERARELFRTGGRRSIRRISTRLSASARVDVLIGAIYTSDERPRAAGGGRGAADQGAFHRAAQLLGASLAGICPDPDQSRRPRHRRIGSRPGAQPKPRRGACVERPGEDRHGPRGGDGGSCRARRSASSPADAVAFIWNYISGLAKLHLGADEEATEMFRLSTDANRNYPLNYFSNAAALALFGRLDEARSRGQCRTGASAELLRRSFSRRGRQRQSDLPRPARAYRGGHAQGRAPGGLTDWMLSSYKGLGAARVSQGD